MIKLSLTLYREKSHWQIRFPPHNVQSTLRFPPLFRVYKLGIELKMQLAQYDGNFDHCEAT
jgi:hypothetical protein